jgi:hypothetical protein
MSAAVRVVDKAVGFVADSAVKAVEGAIKDPLGTILTIGAVVAAPATGGASLAWLPAVKAGVVIAKGGSIEDAAKSAAISYAAAHIGSAMGDTFSVDGFSPELNTAIKSSVGSTAVATGAGVLRGKDLGDALARGVTSGIGSGISSLVADNADTGGEGSKTNTADRVIGSTVGSAATAALRGQNVGDVAANTLANGALRAGAGQYAGMLPAVTLASTAASLPTHIQNVQPTQGDTASTMSASLDTKTDIPNLSPAQTKEAAQLVRSIDSEGQALDEQGNKIGDAAAFGLTKGIDNTWLTQDGQVIASTDAPVPETGMQMVNETTPEPQAVNNQDGSTTITSPDGSQKIMSPDGTMSYIDAQGNILGQDTSSPLSILADSLLGNEPDGIASPMKAAGGGLMSIQPTIGNQYNADPTSSVQMFAYGGMAHGGISSLGSYSDGGRMLKGPGDGMSDDIPASIAGSQPARLANEEFVIPADVVSHLGNGSSEAGAKVLYAMMERVRKARTGNPKQGKQIHAAKFMPKVRS